MILGISITSASEIIPSICEICGSQKENKMESDKSVFFSKKLRSLRYKIIFFLNTKNTEHTKNFRSFRVFRVR